LLAQQTRLGLQWWLFHSLPGDATPCPSRPITLWITAWANIHLWPGSTIWTGLRSCLASATRVAPHYTWPNIVLPIRSLVKTGHVGSAKRRVALRLSTSDLLQVGGKQERFFCRFKRMGVPPLVLSPCYFTPLLPLSEQSPTISHAHPLKFAIF
jgi:hypothetical protein